MEKMARTADKIHSWREIRGHGTRHSRRGPRGSNLVPPAASRANSGARSPHKNWVEGCLRCLSGLPFGDWKFESISLQQTVSLSPAAAFEGREPRFSARVWAAGLATGSAETRQAFHCA